MKKYDVELQTLEQKQKFETERENMLVTNECNRKMKQIRLGLLLLFFKLYFDLLNSTI